MYKSEQLAYNIKQLIENGSLKANEKLPSLRDQVDRSGLSLMTVLNAYQELESQGLIYSIEKSGYFVAGIFSPLIPSNPNPTVALNAKVKINSLVFKYLKSIQPSEVVPLGSAFPNHQLLNPPKLIQIMGQLTRNRQNFEQNNNLPPGNFELRKLIAQRYCMQGIPTQPDDIVITSGCLDALNLSLQALTKAGDYILLQETIFYGAWQIAERLGLKVVTIPEHPQEGFDIEAFEQAIQTYPIKVCWFMLNCHNPIGFTVNEKIKFQIAKLLHEYQIYLIEDDVYEELFYRGTKPLSMKYFDQHNLVLHCSSFSKTLGSTFRIGWVYAGKFSEHIQHLQLMSTISANTLMQNALVEFISNHHYEKHLRVLRRNLEKNKRIFFEYFKKNLPAGCEIHNYAGGYFLWLTLPSHISSMTLYEHLIQQNIGVAPSQLFNVQHAQKNHLRINCSFAWTKEIEMAVKQLIKYMSKLQN
ncbi:PLP-dependent aminotransferase family protein [Acinetobacter puyangensis]|uniref:aminotransferase-like domain-containing protein n=1 Tax=Acinetobacter puyangensis TaxID=1096779 RepID=UPI003A4DCD05